MIKNTKRYKDRDPQEFFANELEDRSFSKDISFFLNFYNKNEFRKKRKCSEGFHFSEGDFENVINESTDPDLMRSILTIFNIVDETFSVLLNHHYQEFREIFPLPRFESYEKKGEVGNINLIPLRKHKDKEEEILYQRFNREIIQIFRYDLWHFGSSDTNKGFITELTTDCEECRSLDLLIPDHFIDAIEVQCKYCFRYPLFYSGLRKQLKDTKKLF